MPVARQVRFVASHPWVLEGLGEVAARDWEAVRAGAEGWALTYLLVTIQY